jgi:hypothetical protein
MNSPTTRSLALLRKEGWRAAVVERWNAHARVRQDLFGFIDILAMDMDGNLLAIQATSASNQAARLKKIQSSPVRAVAKDWLQRNSLEVWGWSKRGNRKLWTVTRTPVTLFMLMLSQSIEQAS